MRPAGVVGVFIAGTDTGVGKTRVAVALLQALERRGIAALGMKPVATGLDASGDHEDVARLRAASRASGERLSGGARPGPDGAAEVDPADVSPYRFAPPVSPHLAARWAGTAIEPARIVAAYGRLARRCEALIVEGTGGWLAPIADTLTMADVARALALPVVLVVGLRLGCLNHALLTARAVRADGLQLAGWIGSVLEPRKPGLDENVATLEQRLPAPRLGLLVHAADRDGDAAQLAPAAAALAAARSAAWPQPDR